MVIIDDGSDNKEETKLPEITQVVSEKREEEKEEKQENKEDLEKEQKIDDDKEYKIDAAKLLDLLTILMKRSHVESLKLIQVSEDGNINQSSGLSSTTAFLSCLQRESLIWITKRLNNNENMEKQWINILGEHANELCQTSIDLCSKMMNDALNLIRHLKYSIVGSILPSYLFALSCMNFIENIPNLMNQLTILLSQLDKIYTLCQSEIDDDNLNGNNNKFKWLIELENIIAA